MANTTSLAVSDATSHLHESLRPKTVNEKTCLLVDDRGTCHDIEVSSRLEDCHRTYPPQNLDERTTSMPEQSPKLTTHKTEQGPFQRLDLSKVFDTLKCSCVGPPSEPLAKYRHELATDTIRVK
jgi:hypothetical protein